MLIKIKNLEINCNIGIYQWEKTFDRQLIINIEIETANEESTYSDNIDDTVSYETIYNNIKQIIASKKYNLIEAMARDILDMILQQKNISFAKVEIDKIKIFPDVYSCTICLEKRL